MPPGGRGLARSNTQRCVTATLDVSRYRSYMTQLHRANLTLTARPSADTGPLVRVRRPWVCVDAGPAGNSLDVFLLGAAGVQSGEVEPAGGGGAGGRPRPARALRAPPRRRVCCRPVPPSASTLLADRWLPPSGQPADAGRAS